MKTHRPVPREQAMFLVVLILLSFSAVVLWLMDPAHRNTGEPRIGWPFTTRLRP